jgi:hypothetical protein
METKSNSLHRSLTVVIDGFGVIYANIIGLNYVSRCYKYEAQPDGKICCSSFSSLVSVEIPVTRCAIQEYVLAKLTPWSKSPYPEPDEFLPHTSTLFP